MEPLVGMCEDVAGEPRDGVELPEHLDYRLAILGKYKRSHCSGLRAIY